MKVYVVRRTEFHEENDCILDRSYATLEAAKFQAALDADRFAMQVRDPVGEISFGWVDQSMIDQFRVSGLGPSSNLVAVLNCRDEVTSDWSQAWWRIYETELVQEG